MNVEISSLAVAAAEKRDLRLLDFCSEEENALGGIYTEISALENRYSEKTKIASGGMKVISRAFDHQANRYIAMANLHAGSDQDLYEPFLREARLNAVMDHPNIMSIHDIGIDENGQPFFTMDLKSDNHLGKIIDTLNEGQRQSLSQRELLTVFLKVCDAMSYAHSCGVLHLDLKPENIQVGKFGEVLVCDWGLGKIITEQEADFDSAGLNPDLLNDMTLNGQIKGTPGFMAPEQVSCQPKTFQTDIYALGAVLYALLTKEKPFSGDSVEEILNETLSEESIIVGDSIPQSLKAVILKAMSKKPEDRYEAVENMAADIEAYLNGFATSAENANLYKLAKLVLNRHKAVSFLLLLFISFSLLATSLFINNLEAEKATALAAQKEAAFLAAAERKAREEADAKSSTLEKLNASYVKSLVKQSLFMSNQSSEWMLKDPKMHKVSIDLLNKAKNLAPDSPQVWKKRAELCFIMQRFPEVLVCTKFFEAEEWPLFKIAQIYSEIKIKHQKLTMQDFVELLELIAASTHKRFHRPLIDKMIAYDQVFDKGRNNEEKLILTKSMIGIWNSRWRGTFDFDQGSRQLIVGGEDLKTLKSESNERTSNQSLLRLINPLELTFEKSPLHKLSHLDDLGVIRLDISKTAISNLSALKFFRSLKYLKLDKDKFSPDELKKIPPWILVEDSI